MIVTRDCNLGINLTRSRKSTVVTVDFGGTFPKASTQDLHRSRKSTVTVDFGGTFQKRAPHDLSRFRKSTVTVDFGGTFRKRAPIISPDLGNQPW